jgi:hypothetical protein
MERVLQECKRHSFVYMPFRRHLTLKFLSFVLLQVEMLVFAEPRGGELVPPATVVSVRAEQAPALLVAWLAQNGSNLTGSEGDASGNAKRQQQQQQGQDPQPGQQPQQPPPRQQQQQRRQQLEVLQPQVHTQMQSGQCKCKRKQSDVLVPASRVPETGSGSQAESEAALVGTPLTVSPGASAQEEGQDHPLAASNPAAKNAAECRTLMETEAGGEAAAKAYAGSTSRQDSNEEGEGRYTGQTPAAPFISGRKASIRGRSRFASEVLMHQMQVEKSKGRQEQEEQVQGQEQVEEPEKQQEHMHLADPGPQGSQPRDDFLAVLADAAAAEAAAYPAGDCCKGAGTGKGARDGSRDRRRAASLASSSDDLGPWDTPEPAAPEPPMAPPRRRPKPADSDDEDYVPSAKSRRGTPEGCGGSPLRLAAPHTSRHGSPGGVRTPPRTAGSSGALAALPGSPQQQVSAGQRGATEAPGCKSPHAMLCGGPCSECGAMLAPQWRKHPATHSDLCNACGIRVQRAMHKAAANTGVDAAAVKAGRV